MDEDPETYFMNNTYLNHGNDNDYDSAVGDDEAAAIAELVRDASLAGTTVHCHLGAKRQRDEDGEPADFVAPAGSGLLRRPPSLRFCPANPNFEC